MAEIAPATAAVVASSGSKCSGWGLGAIELCPWLSVSVSLTAIGVVIVSSSSVAMVGFPDVSSLERPGCISAFEVHGWNAANATSADPCVSDISGETVAATSLSSVVSLSAVVSCCWCMLGLEVL